MKTQTNINKDLTCGNVASSKNKVKALTDIIASKDNRIFELEDQVSYLRYLMTQKDREHANNMHCMRVHSEKIFKEKGNSIKELKKEVIMLHEIVKIKEEQFDEQIRTININTAQNMTLKNNVIQGLKNHLKNLTDAINNNYLYYQNLVNQWNIDFKKYVKEANYKILKLRNEIKLLTVINDKNCIQFNDKMNLKDKEINKLKNEYKQLLHESSCHNENYLIKNINMFKPLNDDYSDKLKIFQSLKQNNYECKLVWMNHQMKVIVNIMKEMGYDKKKLVKYFNDFDEDERKNVKLVMSKLLVLQQLQCRFL